MRNLPIQSAPVERRRSARGAQATQGGVEAAFINFIVPFAGVEASFTPLTPLIPFAGVEASFIMFPAPFARNDAQ